MEKLLTSLVLGVLLLTNPLAAQELFILDSANFNISETTINTKGDDIAPFLHNDNLFFLCEQNSDFAEHLNIFTLKKAAIGEDGKPYDIKVVDEIFNHPPSGGPVAISEDGNKAIFAKEVHIKHVKSKEKFKFFLFSTEKDSNGIWTSPTQLPFDDEHYSCSHPTLNNDFTKMYFVSDNQEGKGGADIWYTEFVNGTWQNPIDLGNKINTDGKEIFPFLYDDNTLFFASDNHEDALGLDLYVAKVNGKNILSIDHLPPPINGPQNDFSITFSKDRLTGFFCSDRNIKNGDDIFMLKFKDSKTQTSLEKKKTQPNTSSQFELSENDYKKIYAQLLNEREKSKCVTIDINNGLDTKNKNLSYLWRFSDDSTEKGSKIKKCFSKRDDFTTILYTVDKITSMELFENTYNLNLKNKEIDINLKNSFWVGEKLIVDYGKSDIISAAWNIDGKLYNTLQPNITFLKNGTISLTGLIVSNGEPLNFTEVKKTLTIHKSILDGINLTEKVEEQTDESHLNYLKSEIDLKLIKISDSTELFFKPISSLNKYSDQLEPNSSYTLSIWKGNKYSNEVVINTSSKPKEDINKELKKISLTKLNSLSPVFFKLNSSKEIEIIDSLKNIITQLKNKPNAVIEIGSYTHSEGDNKQNEKLSIARSEYIKKQLAKELPNISIRIANPENNTSLFNSKPELNRRTDIKIISL